MSLNFITRIPLWGSFFICVNFTSQTDGGMTNNQQNQFSIMDYHTLSNYKEVPITHCSLQLNVDFDQRRLSGSVTHLISNDKKSSQLVLDTKYLQIDSIADQNGGDLSFNYGENDELLGLPLIIQLNDNTEKVQIWYSTTDKSEALDWLVPEQTAGKDYPFMYTQGQSIFTRSWIPIQDSPGLRVTYSADVQVPTGLFPVMSASNPQTTNDDNMYHFEMQQPISPYLIALAVGNLEFRSIDHRTGVYAEPSMLEACANELVDMGRMVDVAEDLYGEYDWDRYDVIVLPPSFPFGGMENPRLTFATPTIIAGDRSLVSLIAHELAHSWSGNLVTNATWDDFWLNEGFTVYFERRIMEALYGKDYVEMLALLGYQDLLHEVENLKPSLQTLKLNLKNLHPDNGMSDIAYEKGYFFLRMLEAAVGRPKMDQFLKDYFKNHKFQTIVTEDFIVYMKEHLLDGNSDEVNIEEWVYQPGLPSNCPIVVSERFRKVEASIEEFTNGSKANKMSTDNWSTHEWIHFIKHLPIGTTADQLADLDSAFELSQSGNSEILAVWFLQSIRADYQTAFVPLENFLTRVGRRKFLQPLYEELSKTEKHKEWAKNVYAKARSNYHYVSFNTVDRILNY